jgi:hypothetical protein
MRISEWSVLHEVPNADNTWAFTEEFKERNPFIYNSTFDDGLLQFWKEVSEIYRRIVTAKRSDWLPADFYFTFFAHKTVWSFGFYLRTLGIEDTAFYCRRDTYAPGSDFADMRPTQIECYLSNISIEDNLTLNKIFNESRYRITGNYMSIQL